MDQGRAKKNLADLIWLVAIAGVFSIWGCATLPSDFKKTESHVLPHTGQSALGELVAAKQENFPGKSGFHLLEDGQEAFLARAQLAEMAEHTIDTQYYLYHKDTVGRLFSHILVKAADRGVRVRLLIDDMDLGGRDEAAMAMDSHPNIEVRVFNPFSRNWGRAVQFITRLGSVTRRMHNKSYTVDNQLTILGGRNIGDEYFSANPELDFADLDVMCMGPVAAKVSGVFDQYWNSELAYPISALYQGKALTQERLDAYQNSLEAFVQKQEISDYLQGLRSSSLAEKIRTRSVDFQWGTAQILYDQPEKILHSFDETQYHLSSQLRSYWESIKEELIILSPYFVPGKEGVRFLTHLARKGVRVKILTNALSSNDVALVHAGYKKYRKALLRAGVALYEMDSALTREQRTGKKGSGASHASLHAKTFVFDRRQVFVGSLNLDPRALKHNTEIGVIFQVPPLAQEMARTFDKKIEQNAFRLELKSMENGSEKLIWHGHKNGNPVIYTHDPYTGFWKRLGLEIISWLPFESQL